MSQTLLRHQLHCYGSGTRFVLLLLDSSSSFPTFPPNLLHALSHAHSRSRITPVQSSDLTLSSSSPQAGMALEQRGQVVWVLDLFIKPIGLHSSLWRKHARLQDRPPEIVRKRTRRQDLIVLL